jgi:transposase
LERHLKGLADKAADTPADAEPSSTAAHGETRSRIKRRRKAGSHTPQFDLGRELHRISGVDLTRIDGIDVGVAQTVISEVGFDMARWKTEAHFASWLGLCPDNRITGGKVIRKGTRHVSQSSGDGFTARGHHVAEKSELPRCPIPPPPRQTWRPESHHRDGSQARSPRLSHAEAAARVRR